MERKVFIITGISGAGKSQALKCFEDFGFFCVDNLPIDLIRNFAELLQKNPSLSKIALGIDIREGKFLKGFSQAIQAFHRQGIPARILYLEAEEPVLIRRFSETRHRHPLGLRIGEALAVEGKRLREIKAIADRVIDTSALTLGELKEALSTTLEIKKTKEMNLAVISFGYKYGIPLDADLVIDVRFLPNPNYVPRLKPKHGLMQAVQNYVLKDKTASEFLKSFFSWFSKLLPHYIKEGKSYLTLAVGCTGGRHRSVAIAHKIAQHLQGHGYPVREYHRDLDK